MKTTRRETIKLLALSGSAALPILGQAESAGQGSYLDILKALSQLKDKPSKLRFMIPNGCQANLKPLQALLSEKAGISLDYAVAPVDDINTQLSLSVGSDDLGDLDLALPATFGLPDLATNKVIQPLDRFATQYEPSGFQSDALYTLGDYFHNNLFGYQTDGDAYTMFYNRLWLEDTNYQKSYEDRFGRVLAVPDTWEELDRQMQFFHAPDQGRYGGSLYRMAGYLAWEWWVRFHAKGYFPLKDDLEPQIDNAAGVAALEELIRAGQYLSPGSRTNGLFENWAEYGQGQCYCNIGWGGTQKYLNSSKSRMRGKLAYSPIPGGVIRGQTVSIPYFNWGWNYTVPTAARSPEASYLVALLAVSPELSSLAVRENGFFDPFRERHYQDDVIKQMYSESFLEAHRKSMQNSIPDFYLVGQTTYMATLKTYLHRALRGDMSPADALRSAANSWRGLHHRFGLETQLKTWQKLKSRYPKTLRALLT